MRPEPNCRMCPLQVLMAQQSAASTSVCGTTKWSWRSMNLKIWGLRMHRPRTFGGTSSSRPRAWNFRNGPPISNGKWGTLDAQIHAFYRTRRYGPSIWRTPLAAGRLTLGLVGRHRPHSTTGGADDYRL